ncbi:hypothetical protein FOA52_013146 [Chlamydomonas sp. UWO 241]|nr:hypothetical protein FOA52_013146 [Chlamydomonas sp. UWO 241]
MTAATHYVLYWVALGMCSAGWCVQIAGLSALQHRCEEHIHPANNEVRPVIALLEASKVALGQILTMAPGSAQSAAMMGFIAKSYPGVLSAIGTLTSRSSTTAFTLTPDTDCGHYYRYLWVNTSLQFAICVIVAVTLARRMQQRTKAAVCSLLALVTLLGINNIHMSFYIRFFLPEHVPTEAYCFLVGCVFTVVFNIVMIIQHGTQELDSSTMLDSTYPVQGSSFKVPAHPSTGSKTSEDSIDGAV